MRRAIRNTPKKKRDQKKRQGRKDLSALFANYSAGMQESDADKVFESAHKIFAETSSPDAVNLAFQAALKMPDANLAADAFSKIASLAPKNADIQNDYGALLCKSERYEEAEIVFRQTLLVTPNDRQVLFNMGQALLGQEKFSEAENFLCEAIALDFQVPPLFASLGDALKGQGKVEQAIECYRKAFYQDRSNLDLRKKLKDALWDWGKGFSELERLYVADLVNDPENFLSAMQLACIYTATERRNRARLIVEKWLPRQGSLEIGDQAQLREILSELQCLDGDFKNAMPNYHWRLKRWKRWSDGPPYPEWHGETLEGKSILVFAEQGVGDQVMFMSLLPDLISTSDEVYVECDPRLVKLFQRSFPRVDFLPVINTDRVETGNRTPDFQVAMGSLGCWLWDEFEQRRKVSYLVADAAQSKRIQARYRKHNRKTLVGISWSSPLGKFPGLKSLKLNDLAPLFKMQDAIVIDLQYGDTAEERKALEASHQISLLHDQDINQLEDIDIFAAQVAAMDVVLTVSNSVAHIAGALGVPTIVLLPPAPQWKWSGDSADSIWYPNVYLVRRSLDESVESHVERAVDLIRDKFGAQHMLQ